MNKKVYFILSGVIQIITSIYAIFNANELAKSLTNTVDMFTGKVDGSIDAIIKNGNVYIIIMALVCILLNVLIICWASKNKILKKKVKKVLIPLSLPTIANKINRISDKTNIILPPPYS